MTFEYSTLQIYRNPRISKFLTVFRWDHGNYTRVMSDVLYLHVSVVPVPVLIRTCFSSCIKTRVEIVSIWAAFTVWKASNSKTLPSYTSFITTAFERIRPWKSYGLSGSCERRRRERRKLTFSDTARSKSCPEMCAKMHNFGGIYIHMHARDIWTFEWYLGKMLLAWMIVLECIQRSKLECKKRKRKNTGC